MKNQIKVLVILSLLVNNSFAQTLSQDAEGKSTVQYQGGNISLDIAKANLTFAYTNLGQLSKSQYSENKPKFAWGVNAYGKNDEGTSLLFDKGEFQANVGFGGFLGLSFRADRKPSELEPLNIKLKEIEKIRDDLQLKAGLLKNKKDKQSKKKLAKLNASIEDYEKLMDELNSSITAINEKRVRRMFLVYAKGGRSATSFKLEEPNPTGVPLSKTFTTTDFYGGNLAMGINYEIGRFLLGFEINREFTNNFETLTKSTYTLKNTEAVGSSTLETQKEIVAYAGAYQKYKRIDLNFDMIMFSSLDNKEKDYIAWNFYIRHKISESKLIIPTYTNMGLGAYFFNKSNKFMGGFYVEAPDTFEDVERKKAEPNFKKLHDRLTFGLVARFSFSSIVGPKF